MGIRVKRESIGAPHVVNSYSESYKADLTAAIGESGATLAFDATAGGDLTSDILTAMDYIGSKDAVVLNT